MRYFYFSLLAIVLASCSVLLQDEKEIDKVFEDLMHEELSKDF